MGLIVDIEKRLKNINLKVAFSTVDVQGISGILGASGCGKSMTLKCIAGIETPDRGRIVLNGRVLFDKDEGICLKPQQRKVGYLFQNYALFPHMTVAENVEFALKGTKAEKKGRAMQYLELLHIGELAEHYPMKLSGGQQQRAALARILAFQPDLLMLDEPFSALDYYMKEALQLALMDELKNYRGDILLVTHNRDEIYRMCRQIHVLEQGKLVVSGPVKEVFADPKVVAAARLTGCKNIVRIEKISEHEFMVPEWNRMVRIEKKVPDYAGFIGIRAHYLRKQKPGETEQLMEFSYSAMLEDPFEITLIMEHGIWWKIPKETWKHEFEGQLPQYYVIPEDGIFFLEGDIPCK